MWQTLPAGRGDHILLSMAALLPDELHIVVTECGNAIWEREICRRGTALGSDAGWSVLDQRRSPLRLAKSHSASFRAFGIRTGKRCLSTATSAPQTRQVRGRRLGFLGLGPNRVYVKTTADRAKITHARTERPCDPDDAITWQSLGGIVSFRTSLYFSRT